MAALRANHAVPRPMPLLTIPRLMPLFSSQTLVPNLPRSPRPRAPLWTRTCTPRRRPQRCAFPCHRKRRCPSRLPGNALHCHVQAHQPLVFSFSSPSRKRRPRRRRRRRRLAFPHRAPQSCHPHRAPRPCRRRRCRQSCRRRRSCRPRSCHRPQSYRRRSCRRPRPWPRPTRLHRARWIRTFWTD